MTTVLIPCTVWDALTAPQRAGTSTAAPLTLGQPAVVTDDKGVDYYAWDDPRVTVDQIAVIAAFVKTPADSTKATAAKKTATDKAKSDLRTKIALLPADGRTMKIIAEQCGTVVKADSGLPDKWTVKGPAA